MQENYYTVGVITGTHGLRGEVKVFNKTDFPELRFRKGSKLFLRKPGDAPSHELVVSTARQHGRVWLVAFQGLATISDVEHWRGYELCVHESQLTQLPEGSYYIHELVGMTVVSDDGRTVGVIQDVLTPGANDVYVVKGDLQKKDVLIPAIADCVKDVDVSAKRMTVHLMPGLLEADDEEQGGE